MAGCIRKSVEQMEEGGILSLIENLMEKCRILNKTRVDDAYGSETITWSEGTSFDASIIKDSTTEAIVAEKQGITEIFTVVVKKGFSLSYNEYFKRVSDGQVFRVTSNVTDSEAPGQSTIRIAKVTAEKAVLPDA